MEVTQVEQFLGLLEKSELLTAKQLEEVRPLAPQHANAESLARALARQGLLTRWQAGQLLIGRTSFMLGKYRLLDLLGRGGMGSVFLAEHVMMNRRVAIKQLSRGLAGNPAALERFLGEARAVAALDDPNIVRAYNVDNEGDRYYLVMEYVEGKTLEQVVQERGRLDFATAADLIRQAADGLAHAHQRKMVHRDVKPANLLLNDQGVVKILDMGLARLAGEDSGKGEEHVLGTVDFMAPEQGLGSDNFDHRADIYSLGCTLYFLLTGHAPFPEGTLAQRILKHQTQQPQSIVEQRPDAPRELVKICRKMMAKSPEERYQSADEVSKALSQLDLQSRELKRARPLDDTAPGTASAAGSDTHVLDAAIASRALGSAIGAKRDASGVSRIRKAKKSNKLYLIVGAAVTTGLLLLAGVWAFLSKSPAPLPEKSKHRQESVEKGAESRKTDEKLKTAEPSPTPESVFRPQPVAPVVGGFNPDAKPPKAKPAAKAKPNSPATGQQPGKGKAKQPAAKAPPKLLPTEKKPGDNPSKN